MEQTNIEAVQTSGETNSELLLREAHHRVGNHLQLLASLIALQARTEVEAATREALLQVRNRVLAVGRIHDDLRCAGRSDSLDLSTFLAQIAQDFERSFGGLVLGRLKLDIDGDLVNLPGETVMTLGLILNELISNALKHASTAEEPTICVQLQREASQLWRLRVADNGPGLPDAIADDAGDDGHGLALVKLLARKIHGGVSIEKRRSPGASVAVYFT